MPGTVTDAGDIRMKRWIGLMALATIIKQNSDVEKGSSNNIKINKQSRRK